jgi:predicted amidophosphoribosyltransferase
LAPAAERCGVCDRPSVAGQKECGNFVCGWPSRGFEWNFAIGMRSGVLERIGNRYKFDEVRAWALILGRILVGFLDENREVFEDFDLIIPSPSFTGEGAARHWDHTRELVQMANDAANGRWPFHLDPPAIVKESLVQAFKGKGWAQRREIAEGELRKALRVPDPKLVRGRSVLVYDDIFTDGFTLREIARALRGAGARRVCGVSLMRAPFRGAPGAVQPVA